MTILKCDKLCVSYDNATVVQNASFEINDGDYVLIVGENGSGKSTLVKAILGLLSPSSGTLSFEGGLSQSEIGYLAQQNEVKREFPASVMEVVMSGFCGKKGFFPFYTKAQKQLAHKNLKKLDIDAYSRHPISELSGGQIRRVLLARALCATKKLILCDEPAAGLDTMGTTQLYDAIKRLNDEKITVIMVTHDLKASLAYATKVIHMANDGVYVMQRDEYAKSELAHKLFGIPD